MCTTMPFDAGYTVAANLGFPQILIRLIRWDLSLLLRFSPASVLSAIFALVLGSFRSRAALQLEIIALRHQISVLRRSGKRPNLTDADRVFWAWLSEVWSNWRTALVIVKPETVIAWHRRGFRWFWTLEGPARKPCPSEGARRGSR